MYPVRIEESFDKARGGITEIKLLRSSNYEYPAKKSPAEAYASLSV